MLQNNSNYPNKEGKVIWKTKITGTRANFHGGRHTKP